MNSPWIAGLRSVALTVPDLAAAEDFYTKVWQLTVAARSDCVLQLRGSGSDHHVLALHAATGTPTIRQVTLRARTAGSLVAIANATLAAASRSCTAMPSAGSTIPPRASNPFEWRMRC